MMERANVEFHQDMVRGAQALQSQIGYNPSRFLQMVAEHGGVEASKRLLTGPDASDGFTVLWEHSRLEMSLEAFALLPWYAPLFTRSELRTARRRLEAHSFDVDEFLEGATVQPPDWWEPCDTTQ